MKKNNKYLLGDFIRYEQARINRKFTKKELEVMEAMETYPTFKSVLDKEKPLIQNLLKLGVLVEHPIKIDFNKSYYPSKVNEVKISKDTEELIKKYFDKFNTDVINVIYSISNHSSLVLYVYFIIPKLNNYTLAPCRLYFEKPNVVAINLYDKEDEIIIKLADLEKFLIDSTSIFNGYLKDINNMLLTVEPFVSKK